MCVAVGILCSSEVLVMNLKLLCFFKSDMRKHLLKCFTGRKMETFPREIMARKKSVNKSERIE